MKIFNLKAHLLSGGSEIARLPGKLKNMFRGSRTDATLNEVLFYGAEDEDKRKKVGLNNLFCIYYVIIHANISIDLCAPSLSSDTIAKSLVTARQKGNVRIRIAVYNSVNCEHLRTFSKHEIEVKSVSSSVHLEHDFVLIDARGDAVAIVGSVDYEVARVNCNRDTTLLTSEPTVVSAFVREFDRIWNTVPDIMN